MSRIYEEQATSVMPSVSFGPNNLAINQTGDTKNLNNIALKQAEQARQIYSNALNTDMVLSMDKLYDKFGNNPEKLDEEIGKLESKLSEGIVDNEIKVNFLANSMIRRASYINKAKDRFNKIQSAQAKSTTFDTIQNNVGIAKISFQNILNGVGTEDDIVNSRLAMHEISTLIDKKDLDGINMFSDAQRWGFRKQVDQANFAALTDTFIGLKPQQQKEIADKIDSEELTIGSLSAKQLKEHVGAEVYNDFQTFVRKANGAMSALKKSNKDSDDEELAGMAALRTMNEMDFETRFKELQKEHDASDKDNAFDLLSLRQEARLAAEGGQLDKKVYKKLMEDSSANLIKSAEASAINDGFFSIETAMDKGVDYFAQGWPDLSSYQKAYLYSELYSRLLAAGVDPSAPKTANNYAQIKQVAKQLEKEFIEDQMGGVGDINAAKVLIGDNLVNYQ